MGHYLNPGSEGFRKMVNSDIYTDKTGILKYTNRVLNTMQNYCASAVRAVSENP